MSTLIKVSKARTNRDILEALKLNERLFPQDSPPQVDDGLTTWWLARTANGDSVGFCGLRENPELADTGYLERAGVLSRFTGLGVHSKFIRIREAEARKRGWVAATTWAVASNVRSLNNLIKHGYRFYTPEEPWGTSEVVYLRKAL